MTEEKAKDKEVQGRDDGLREFDSQAEIERVKHEVMAAPAPGTDPDSRRRVAKTLESLGIDLPDGYSLDPITAEERQKWDDDVTSEREKARTEGEKVAEKDRKDATTAAEKRSAATDSDQTPRGRTTTPRVKAAEEK